MFDRFKFGVCVCFFFLILSVTVALLLPMPVCVSVFRTLWIRLFVMLIDIKVYSFSDVSNDVRCVTHNCTEYREYKVKDSQNSWNCRESILFRYHSRSLCFFFFSCISVCVFEDEVLKKKKWSPTNKFRRVVEFLFLYNRHTLGSNDFSVQRGRKQRRWIRPLF